MELYSLPYYQRARFNRFINLLFFFCAILFGIGAGFFLIIVTKDELTVGLLGGLFMLVLSVCFAYMIIFIGVLKKGYIEITSEYFEVSLLFKIRKVYWKEIYNIEVFEFNNNIMFGILLKKDRLKKRKRTISNGLNSLYGVPPCSFQISLAFFKDINIEKLLLTIEEQISKNTIDNELTIEEIINDNEEVENSIIKAIIGSFMLCIFMSAIYGFVIYKLKTNHVVIPIFSSMFIISVFNKYYIEKSFSLGVRLLLGFLCIIQIPIAMVEHIILTAKIEFTISNILDITTGYFEYLIDHPLKQIVIIITSVICFGMGIFRGRVERTINEYRKN